MRRAAWRRGRRVGLDGRRDGRGGTGEALVDAQRGTSRTLRAWEAAGAGRKARAYGIGRVGGGEARVGNGRREGGDRDGGINRNPQVVKGDPAAIDRLT